MIKFEPRILHSEMMLIIIKYASVEYGDEIYQDMEKLSAYEMALKTWSDWLENHVNPNKTRVFFVSLSPAHPRYIPIIVEDVELQLH